MKSYIYGVGDYSKGESLITLMALADGMTAIKLRTHPHHVLCKRDAEAMRDFFLEHYPIPEPHQNEEIKRIVEEFMGKPKEPKP